MLLDGADWTVMVYMAGDGNLERAAVDDFLEIAKVGSGDRVQVVVQLDRSTESDSWLGGDDRYGDWTDTRRGVILPHQGPDLGWGESIGETNTGDPAELSTFLHWAQSHFPADRYALVLWGHGQGYPGACYDDGQGEDPLTPAEIESAIAGTAETLDLIGFDACLMCMAEVAHQLAGHADVFVGSQETESGRGWSYHKLLQDLAGNPDWTAAQFGSDIVDRFEEDYGGPYSYDCLSSIDLSALSGPGGLTAAVSEFAGALIDQSSAADLDRLEDLWYETPYFGDYDRTECYYNDLGGFLDLVANDAELPEPLRWSAQDALDVYDQAVLSHFAGEWAYSTGMSVYFPERGLGPNDDYNSADLKFAGDTMWDEFLHWWHDGTIPVPEIALLGSGRSINNGDFTPGTQDGTDFGYVSVGGGQKSRDFVIQSHGTATLALGGDGPVEIAGPAAGDFTVTTQPPSRIHAGEYASFRITFSPTAGGVRSATVRIVNNDADESPYTFALRGTGRAASLSINDVDVDEGDDGTTSAVFTVTISEDPTAVVSVGYATADASAEAGSDYQAVSGTLTFQPGGPGTQTISVPVTGDADPESQEMFYVVLSDAVNAAITRAQGKGRIQDDDGRIVDFGGKTRATFGERDGDQVTVTLTGSGLGRVVLDDESTIRAVELAGTTSRSSLRIAVRKAGAGDGAAQVHGITVEGSLKSISGKAARLAGDLEVGGLLGSLTLGNVGPDCRIDINTGLAPAGPRDTVALALGRVADTAVDTHGQPIRSLTAVEWLNGEGSGIEQIAAPSLGKLTIKGDRRAERDGHFQATLVLDGSDGAKLTLGRAKIAGAVDGPAWDIAGAVGAIAIAGGAADWTLHSSTDGLSGVKSLALGPADHVVIDVNGPVGAIRAAAWAGGRIEADTVKSLKVPGNRQVGLDGNFSADLSLRGDPTAKQTLGGAKVAGTVGGGTWRIDGNAGKIAILGAGTGWALQGGGPEGTGLRCVKSLTLGEADGCTVKLDDVLSSLKATRWTGGGIDADRLDALKITGDKRSGVPGDFTGQLTLRGENVPPRKAALKSASIAGDLRDSTWRVGGEVGKVKVGGWVRASDLCAAGSVAGLVLGGADGGDFFAGIDLQAIQPGDRRADDDADFADLDAKIGALTIRGWKVAKGDEPPRFVTDSNFSAPSFGPVSLLNAAGGSACGLFVVGDDTHIKSVRHRDTLDREYTWSWKPGKAWPEVGGNVTVQPV